MPPSNQRNSDMPPPSKRYTDMLIAEALAFKGNSKSKRDRDNRQRTDMLGRTHNPAALMSAHHQGNSGKYTKGAIPLSLMINEMQKPNSQSLANAAARKKEKEAVKQRKEAVLREILRNKEETKALQTELETLQTAGYKKLKPKPKKK